VASNTRREKILFLLLTIRISWSMVMIKHSRRNASSQRSNVEIKTRGAINRGAIIAAISHLQYGRQRRLRALLALGARQRAECLQQPKLPCTASNRHR